MVPIEAIAGIFGITPIAAGDAITFTWGSNTLIISANSASATLNGNQVDLTIPAIVEGGIMMVAARDIELLKPDNGTIEVMFEASGLNIVISRRK
ncbi:MAG: stalk domain-containing protein [Caldisericia bacterium]